MSANRVLQIRVDLLGIEPRIWRRIQVEAGCTFWDLHVAIQDAMGWQDSHMHHFRVRDPETGTMRFLGLPLEDEVDTEPGWEVEVSEVFGVDQPPVVYEYDFGDSWEHAVVLEKVLPASRGARYPRCVGGARACPPEDVGGTPGYEEFLAAIRDPEHDEHDAYLEWVGGAFDPERFDPKTVRFQDPRRRWLEVFDEAAVAGVALAGRPQLEGGFTGDEVERLLRSPFGADSPLQLDTDLADDAIEESAPLVRDARRFLQVLADEAPLKLTQAGNLPRAALARLIEAGALGPASWYEEGPPRSEQDAPRAAALRMLAEKTGLVRKQHGKLHLTDRGRAVVDGRMRMGELYRMLIGPYVTEFNWAFLDLMPDSRWLQSGFWYALYLLQTHGDRKRPSTFYAKKFARAFPMAVQDFAGVKLRTPEEMLAWAFERRVLRVFGEELGLVRVESPPERERLDPFQVRAGPLLSQVVKWSRGVAAGSPQRRDRRPVAAGGLRVFDVILDLLDEHGVITSRDVQEATGLDAAAVRLHLRRLVADGFAVMEGQRRGTKYRRVGEG